MELMPQVKGYSDSREDEEDEEAASASAAAEIITIPREESSSSRLHQQDAASNNLMNQQRNHQLELMDLSLGRNKNDESNNNNNNESVEKEHMFDKVVTPSDVGKLNRLVIPKQHAEKYFPLDSSSNEKGLLLNFEDRNGKLWRFRYSYWNSSQSYVMTKGWSRFVKEKKLDSGDIVSFQRGLGDLYRHRLYIDWRRRPDHVNYAVHGTVHDPSSTFISPLFLPNQYSISWGGRFYSLPSPPASTASTMPPPRHHDHFHQQHFNYGHMYTFQQQRPQHHHQQYYGDGGGSGNGSGSESVYYLRSTSTPSMSMQQLGDQNLRGQQKERGDNIAPMIIDSVPVAHHHPHHGGTGTSNAGKRLRLFGVNMECASSPEEDSSSASAAPHVTMANSFPSSSLPPLRVPHEDPVSSSTRFRDQRGGPSVPFDLDPSLQYRH